MIKTDIYIYIYIVASITYTSDGNDNDDEKQLKRRNSKKNWAKLKLNFASNSSKIQAEQSLLVDTGLDISNHYFN